MLNSRQLGTQEFLTQFAPLHAVVAVAIAAAARETPVLIVGAPGTGKSTLARAMHGRSPRATHPFVRIDTAVLTSARIERELFGCPRAGRTPAVRAALSARGTLYMSDVGALTPRTQARLARALRRGMFRMAGSSVDRVVRARVIAGAPAHSAGSASRLAAPLAKVLAGSVITLPALSERTVDIPLLAASFVASAASPGARRIDPAAMLVLQQRAWPGNVAELRAVVERARCVAQDGHIRIEDLASAYGAHTLEA